MQAKIFKCFIASPGDTAAEREMCDEVFTKINTTIGQYLNFRIESKKWENDARPSFGKDGQDVINEQLLKDYQIFIGIMWARFGAPTPRSGSGTEEEFDQALSEFKRTNDVELMMYFNTADIPWKNIDTKQLENVRVFKSRLASLGGLYKEYNGADDFSGILYRNLHDYFQETLSKDKQGSSESAANETLKENVAIENVTNILEYRLNESLRIFSNQPAVWVEPVLSKRDLITEKTKNNFEARVQMAEILASPKSLIIKAPPQFGLTCLANHLVLDAWKMGRTWVKIDAQSAKRDDIKKTINKEINAIGLCGSSIDCIIVDSWRNTDLGSKKLLRNLCHEYQDIPVIVMHTTDDLPFQEEEKNEKINRDFECLYLLALPRS